MPSCNPGGVKTPGEVNGSETSHSIFLNPSSYLLALALVSTGVIPVMALYFAMRHRWRALFVQDSSNGSGKDKLGEGSYG